MAQLHLRNKLTHFSPPVYHTGVIRALCKLSPQIIQLTFIGYFTMQNDSSELSMNPPFQASEQPDEVGNTHHRGNKYIHFTNEETEAGTDRLKTLPRGTHFAYG